MTDLHEEIIKGVQYTFDEHKGDWPQPIRGFINDGYTVACAKCGNALTVCATMEQAVERIQRVGWVQDEMGIWHCPDHAGDAK